MFHYRKTHKVYKSFPKPEACPFCLESSEDDKPIYQSKHCYVKANRVHYDLWELKAVDDHLLVIPTRHVQGLHELTPAERADLMNVLAIYEEQGYNIYARAPTNAIKSVAHQHTHLIKTAGEQARGVLMCEKPYFMLKF